MDNDSFLEQCKNTYHANLDALIRDHPGEIAVISGDTILEFGRDAYALMDKYKAPGTPQVLTFSIPQSKDEKPVHLTIPHGILP